MPVSAGILAKKLLKASRPPAEAPMPTIRGASVPPCSHVNANSAPTVGDGALDDPADFVATMRRPGDTSIHEATRLKRGMRISGAGYSAGRPFASQVSRLSSSFLSFPENMRR